MCVFAPSSNHKVLLPLTTLCLFHDCVLRRPCHKWDQECLMRTNRHCRDNVTVFALASNFSSNNVAKVVLYSIFLLDKKDSSGGRCKFAHLFDPPVAVDQRSTRTNVACCVRAATILEASSPSTAFSASLAAHNIQLPQNSRIQCPPAHQPHPSRTPEDC